MDLSKKPLPKGRANQRIEELTKQLTDIRAAHAKKLRVLERQLSELQQNNKIGLAGSSAPPAPAPPTASTAAGAPGSVGPLSSDAKSAPKPADAEPGAKPTAADPNTSAGSGGGASSTAVAAASTALATLSEQLAAAQQQIASLNSDRHALIAKLQEQQNATAAAQAATAAVAAATPTPTPTPTLPTLIPPPPGLSASNAEYISRLEAQFRIGQQQVVTATAANARAEERARQAERALSEQASNSNTTVSTLQQQVSALRGQIEWLSEDKKRAETAQTNLEWQLKQMQSQPVRVIPSHPIPSIPSLPSTDRDRSMCVVCLMCVWCVAICVCDRVMLNINR